ncbi:MAG: DUF2007 domain-containing protein [bacterium]|nr:DUF2007 domain-containing protein [bacterium]
MEKQLKELIVIDGMMEAEIIKSKLENFEIPSVLEFETAGRLMGISMNGLGRVKIMVSPGDYERAVEILDSHTDASEEPEPTKE